MNWTKNKEKEIRMIVKHHDLEAHYLNRRLELLNRLNDYVEQSLYDESFEMNDFHPVIEMLKQQYSDVIDPENLCKTLKRIYPEDMFGIESRGTKAKKWHH